MITCIQQHRLAFFLSILVGLVYVSHHFIIPLFLDPAAGEYYPITVKSYSDEAMLYAPRAHAIMNGAWVMGEFSLSGRPSGPSILPLLNPIFLGGLGKIVGSFKAGLIVSDVIFPALTFLVLYFLAYEISRRKTWSCVFASLFMFIPKFGVALPPVSSLHVGDIVHVLFPFLLSESAPYFSQFEEPKLTFFLFVFAILLFVRALRAGTKKSAIAAGLSFGILFYTYLYDWATMFVALGLFFLWVLYKRDFRAMRQTAIIAGMGLLVSLGYWYNLWLLAEYHDVIVRAGGEFSHSIRFASVWKSYLRIGVLLFGLIALWQQRDRRPVQVLGALLFSYIVVVNAQVIIGLNVQPDHWYRVMFLPVSLSVWLLAMRTYDLLTTPHTLEQSFRMRVIAAFFLLYFFAGVAYGQIVYSIEHAEEYLMPRRVVESFRWLREHTPKGSVVGTLSGSLNSDLLLHTENKIYLPFGFGTLARDEEIWERTMILSHLYGLSADDFKKYIQNSVYYLFAEEYGDQSFDATLTHYERKLPQAIAEKKVVEYARYFQNPKNPYRLDYLYYVDEEKSAIKIRRDVLSLVPVLRKEYDKDGIIIYSLDLLRKDFRNEILEF